jgi:hypothetical protein
LSSLSKLLAGKPESEAVHKFLDSLQRTLSCITRAVVNVRGGYHVSEHPHPLTIGEGLPVSLGSGTDLSIEVKQQYRVLENPNPYEPWQVRTVAYYYTLRETDGPEMLSYQWHPAQRSYITFPHLHLGAGLVEGEGRNLLEGVHLPTGRVALEDFVRLLIEELGVPALREDWEAVLERGRAEFEADRSW